MLRFTPDEVRAMSIPEALLAIEGFSEMRRAEAGASKNEYPTMEEIHEMMLLYPDA